MGPMDAWTPVLFEPQRFLWWPERPGAQTGLTDLLSYDFLLAGALEFKIAVPFIVAATRQGRRILLLTCLNRVHFQTDVSPNELMTTATLSGIADFWNLSHITHKSIYGQSFNRIILVRRRREQNLGYLKTGKMDLHPFGNEPFICVL